MKTKESRFQVHDELTAPERSVPVLKGALAGGGQLSNIVGVLAGSPAALRAYARFRSELRHGTLPLRTQQRIALAVAEHQGSTTHSRRFSAPRARPAWAWTRSRSHVSSTPATSTRRRSCASSRACSRPRRSAAAPPARGGSRGRVGGRADPRGGRPCGARQLRQPRHPRRRRAQRRVGRGGPPPPGRLAWK